ncbi:MAG: hypothetical protein APG08_00828 [Candidatus Methanofastidiosum methylothiophilum]|uniref:Uncharacterized protein n=1 Tax=Candidatus Methanofastidiosum methylothiophilum TaxID=1705564 RepID=A0A150JMB8_9EURY|nr:MAG: hypothetical protein APG08_00828 [Candidatus Methanofastidiosum methylthiophilus]KYC58409.1 MAG: hypothetical protein APG09_00431 [Candidatus Methanofastidiosum methylthiophilus]
MLKIAVQKDAIFSILAFPYLSANGPKNNVKMPNGSIYAVIDNAADGIERFKSSAILIIKGAAA